MNPKNPVLNYGDEAVDYGKKATGYGDDAAEQPVEAVLVAKAKKNRGKFVLIVASGYQGYPSPSDEINALNAGLWMPHSEDFYATASDTHYDEYYGATKADEFFEALRNVKGKISRIAFLGHGGKSGLLGLGGDIVNFNFFNETLDSNDLIRWQQDIDNEIKPKLNNDAVIDLFACNQAIGGTQFIHDLAKSFGIMIRGFSEEVMWCVGYDKVKIKGRGHIGARSQVIKKPCSNKSWYIGVDKFVPPVPIYP